MTDAIDPPASQPPRLTPAELRQLPMKTLRQVITRLIGECLEHNGDYHHQTPVDVLMQAQIMVDSTGDPPASGPVPTLRCPECNHPVSSHLERGYCLADGNLEGTYCCCTLRDMEKRIRLNTGQKWDEQPVRAALASPTVPPDAVQMPGCGLHRRSLLMYCPECESAPVSSPPAWQPIETAPKDGSWVWMRRVAVNRKPGDITISAFRWDASHDGWFAGTGWWPQVDRMFSHWMPLAAPRLAGGASPTSAPDEPAPLNRPGAPAEPSQ